jgi:hypothetical protein
MILPTPNWRAIRSAFWIQGTVTNVGERCDDEVTAVFRSLDICWAGGVVQRVTVVRTVQNLASLIEQHCIGTFFFLELPEEGCRLWCVARSDGPHGVDVETMQNIIPAFGVGRVADAP